MADFVYRNDIAYSRHFFDLEGQTVDLGPLEEITFDHAIEHPNLVPVNEDAVAAYLAARAEPDVAEPEPEPVSTLHPWTNAALTGNVDPADPATSADEAAPKE